MTCTAQKGKHMNSHGFETSRCSCEVCDLHEQRRSVKKLQRILRRQTTEEFGKMIAPGYTCSRCRSHGFCVPKKFHAPCPFANCPCESCVVDEKLKMIDVKIRQRVCMENTRSCDTNAHVVIIAEPEVGIQFAETEVANELQQLLNLLWNASREGANSQREVDYDALDRLFKRETLDIPMQYAPLVDQLATMAGQIMPSLLSPRT